MNAVRSRHLVSLIAFAATLTIVELAHGQTVSDRSSSASGQLVFATSPRLYTAGADLGDDDVNVKVGLSFGPRTDRDAEMLRIDMSKGAAVQASWGDGKSFTLSTTAGRDGEATLEADYQLAPTVDLMIDTKLFGKFNYGWNANELMNELLHGANFQYTAAAQAKYPSWAWEGTSVSVPGAPLATSKLLSTAFSAFSGDLQGELFVAMTTTPKFTYRTTSVQLDGHAPFQAAGQEVSLPITDADHLDVVAKVKGQIDYEGVMTVGPKVTVSQVFGVPISLGFDIGSGKDFAYGSSQAPGAAVAVEFAPTTYRIPLPNVKVRQSTVDLGATPVGREIKKTINIDNTGEMAAGLEIESSDPQFKVTRSTKIAPKGKADIEVAFVASNAGPASATLTVKSNDPDQPTTQIKVTANGAVATGENGAASEEDGAAVAKPGSDSGCGCVTAGAPAPTGAGLGGLLLGLAAVLGRRARRR